MGKLESTWGNVWVGVEGSRGSSRELLNSSGGSGSGEVVGRGGGSKEVVGWGRGGLGKFWAEDRQGVIGATVAWSIFGLGFELPW